MPVDALAAPETMNLDTLLEMVSKAIQLLQKQLQFSNNRLAILVGYALKKKNATDQIVKVIRGIVGPDAVNADYLHAAKDNKKIIVDTIKRFAGLEADAVLIFDPFTDLEAGSDINSIYLGLSRAVSIAIIITTPANINRLGIRSISL